MATLKELKAQAADAGTSVKAKLRRGVTTSVIGVMGALAFFLTTIWVWNWMNSDASDSAGKTAPSAARQTVKVLPAPTKTGEWHCDGQKRTYTLSSEATLIGGGAPCTIFEWGRSDAVTLSNWLIEEVLPAGPGGSISFRATHWRCTNAPFCTVVAAFKPG